MTAVEMFPRSVGRFFAVGFLVGLGALCGACQYDPDGFTEQDRELIGAMALNTPPPADPTNGLFNLDPAGVAAAASLGQELFFDPALGRPLGDLQAGQPVVLGAPNQAGRVACADCHTPAGFFGDDRSSPNNVSLGVGFTARNSPSLVDVAAYRSFGWDGRGDSLWMECAVAYEGGKTMAGTRVRLAKVLSAEKYRDRYQALFGGMAFEPLTTDAGFIAELELEDGGARPIASLSPQSAQYLNTVAANAYKALAVYLAQLVSAGAPIDAYAQGDAGALSPSAKRGLKLFLGRAGCIECHRGNSFTDNQFHSVGISQGNGPHVESVDNGRFAGLTQLRGGDQSVFNSCGPFNDLGDAGRVCLLATPTEGVRGQFRTKSLRNLTRSPPYMHAGQLRSLEEVVRFYNSGGDVSGFAGTRDPVIVPLKLTETDLVDLVTFLEALTGAPPPLRYACDPDQSARSATNPHRYPACAP